jgi:hypothetical protein
MMAKYGKFEVKHTIKTGGDGWPTAEELIEVLRHMPPTVKPDFRRHDSQMEGTSWTLTAEWDEATQQGWKPPHSHANCRCGSIDTKQPPLTPGVRAPRGWDK